MSALTRLAGASNVAEVALEAHALGVRDGLEYAAMYIDAGMGAAGLSDEQLGLAAFLRDEIRLMVHVVPDPDCGGAQ